MDWIQQWQSKLNKQNGVAPLVRTGGSRHTGLAALPHRNIHKTVPLFFKTHKSILSRNGFFYLPHTITAFELLLHDICNFNTF